MIDVLLSYAFHAKTDLAEVRDAIGPDALLIVDSGAYTAHSTGKPITLSAYADFLKRWEGHYSSAVTLDVIGNPAETRRNTETLWDMGLPVLPVFTAGAPVTDLERYCTTAGYVACGGLGGMSGAQAVKYRHWCCERARDFGAVTHLLGVSGVTAMRGSRPYSCDVSTPSRTLLHGTVALWDGRKAVGFSIKDRREAAKMRDLVVGYGLNFRRILEGTHMDPDARNLVVEAALYANHVQGVWMRQHTPPVDRPSLSVHGGPGPRLCAALVTSENVASAMKVGRALRAGEMPPAVRRQLRSAGGLVEAEA